MCGIAGIFSFDNDNLKIDVTELTTIRDHMAKRGPDGYGIWFSNDNTAAFVHRRLSIIDLSETGNQPMVDDETGNSITFNGEIYNYKILRIELESKGYKFKSTSDTEVLLKLYSCYGEKMFDRLRGMFAMGIYDRKNRKLVIARDHFGIKPLYISDNGKKIRFSSQVKSLIAGGGIVTSVDPAGHVGFYLWGHVPEPFTLYKEIRSVKPGTCIVISSDGTRVEHEFFNIRKEFLDSESSAFSISKNDLKDFYCEAICDSLSHHLISDVEVGIFLSAGIDSTTLVSLASENSVGVKGLKTVNIGFNEFHNTIIDETIEAEKISRYYKAQHFSKIVSKHEFISEYDALINAMDQPSIDGVNTYFAAKLASQNNLKVVLSGIGADEILSGYKHFKSMPRLISIIKPFKSLPILGKVFRDFNNLFLRNLVSPKFASLVEFHGDFPSSYLLRRSLFLPWEINNILGQDFTKKGLDDLNTLKELESTVCGIKNEQSIISCLELSWYMRNQLLRDTDWASMAHSLEVRTPFVDPIFFRKILKIVQSGINLDKPSFARFLPNSLPSSVLSRRKTGFNVPVKDWIKDSEQNNGLSNKYGLRKWAYQIKNEFKC